MSLAVVSKTHESVLCEVVDGGELKSRRHLNVRGKSATLPSITGMPLCLQYLSNFYQLKRWQSYLCSWRTTGNFEAIKGVPFNMVLIGGFFQRRIGKISSLEWTIKWTFMLFHLWKMLRWCMNSRTFWKVRCSGYIAHPMSSEYCFMTFWLLNLGTSNIIAYMMSLSWSEVTD